MSLVCPFQVNNEYFIVFCLLQMGYMGHQISFLFPFVRMTYAGLLPPFAPYVGLERPKVVTTVFSQ